MSANRLVQIKTVSGGTPQEPLIAILANLDMNDPATADEFLRDVCKTFISHRMCSPPETNMMLLTVIGDISAARCVEVWRQFMAQDKVLCFFMSQMKAADVVRGDQSGAELEKLSIISGYEFPEALVKMRTNPNVLHGPKSAKPRWKFW